MYEEYWGFTFSPFESVPNPNLYFPTLKHEEAIRWILYAIEKKKGAAMLTGEPGSGKTLISRTVIQKLPEEKYNIGLITNPSLTGLDLLKEAMYQLGFENIPNEKLEIFHRLNDDLLKEHEEGRDTVLFIDEAHVIGDPMIFDELRMLLNFQLNDRFLLTLILLGQPELKEKISKIKQFEQRIAIRYHLLPLDLNETIDYIAYRLKTAGSKRGIFTREAVELIFKKSKGIPREINTICDTCLLIGFERKLERIDSQTVQELN